MKLVKLTDGRFHAALAKLNAQPVPLRVAFKLKGILAKVQEELKKFEECRLSALERYGKKNAEGKLVLGENNVVDFDQENFEGFTKELNDLGETDLEFATVKLEELGEKFELTTDDVAALDGILVE